MRPQFHLKCGGSRENCCPSKVINKAHLQVKWALFEKWRRENSVDFSTPSVEQVSDFFMYLYQDLNRCPSTIYGYRMAIVDTLGLAGLHISQSSDLYRLLSSFHGDCPKCSRNLPNGTLLLCLMSSQSTLLAYKRLRPQTSNSQTAFLLALPSSKHHSELHARVAN